MEFTLELSLRFLSQTEDMVATLPGFQHGEDKDRGYEVVLHSGIAFNMAAEPESIGG